MTWMMPDPYVACARNCFPATAGRGTREFTATERHIRGNTFVGCSKTALAQDWALDCPLQSEPSDAPLDCPDSFRLYSSRFELGRAAPAAGGRDNFASMVATAPVVRCYCSRPRRCLSDRGVARSS